MALKMIGKVDHQATSATASSPSPYHSRTFFYNANLCKIHTRVLLEKSDILKSWQDAPDYKNPRKAKLQKNGSLLPCETFNFKLLFYFYHINHF